MSPLSYVRLARTFDGVLSQARHRMARICAALQGQGRLPVNPAQSLGALINDLERIVQLMQKIDERAATMGLHIRKVRESVSSEEDIERCLVGLLEQYDAFCSGKIVLLD